MQHSDPLPVVSIVGRKNSGKTTLTVALAAELKRRGVRVATVKHGHHRMEIDRPGTDSWRHFHEGEAEAVLLVAGTRVAMVMRTSEEPDPRELIRGLYSGRGYELVLVEGYKNGPFPCVEVFRSEVHPAPLHDPSDPRSADRTLALVTDDAAAPAACPVIPLDPADPGGSHVARLADLLEERLLSGRAG